MLRRTKSEAASEEMGGWGVRKREKTKDLGGEEAGSEK